MTPTHHLTDEVLIAYAAGSLPEAFSLVAACHISLCDDCRAALAGYESVGGSVLSEVDEAPVAETALNDVMTRIATEKGANATARPRDIVFPAPLVDYVGGGVDAVKWRPVGGGVQQALLPTDDEGSVRLLKIPAGAAVPPPSCDAGPCAGTSA